MLRARRGRSIAPRRREAVARGRTRDSGTHRGGRRMPPHRCTAHHIDAVLRVGGVLQRRAGEPRIVDPVAQRVRAAFRKVGNERIVGVDHEDGRGGETAHGLPPALGDVLELPVAVELVAEEVPERNDTRAGRGASPRAERTRRPPGDRDRPSEQRGGWRRLPTQDSRRSCSTRAESGRRGSGPASRSSSSFRSSPRREQRPRGAAQRARRSRPDRPSRAACRAASCRRRDLPPVRHGRRAWRPTFQP